MHIKAIELDNFKSFGRKTRIPLYEDFTVVTGPNGCGKSNIIDAVLFALGLARTRGIRAEKLTDLIYNPGYEDGDRPGGAREAIVEVILDNADRTFDRSQLQNAMGTEDVEDLDEVRVRRRVKETDDNYYSYYYLNGRAVNLSDIQDLLAQAGVAPEGYNVVMQGDVTGIIQMTPQTRREIIDEIAGVAEFDEKKADAYEELEVVQERIDEAELRIEEKRDRLDQLADERRVAMRYRRLEKEKAVYEGYRKASELEDKREELTEATEQVESLEDELSDRQRELDERQGTVVRLEEDLEDLTAEIEAKGEDEQIEIKKEIEEVRSAIDRLEARIETAQEKVEEAEADRREAFTKLDQKKEEIDDIDEQIQDRKLEKASLKREIADLEEDREDLQAELDSIDTEYEEVKEAIEEARESLEAAKDEKNDLQRSKDRLLDSARRRSRKIEEVEADIEAQQEAIPELEDERAELERELEKAARNLEQIEEVVEDLKAEKQSLQEDRESIQSKIDAKQAEYVELEQSAAEGGDAAFPRSVTTLLNAGMDGVHGAVAQLGSVDPEYAEACETAAGGRLANVVVDDDGIGQECIELLKRKNAGRATVLPIAKMQERRLPSQPSDPGVVDFAVNLVDFDGQYAGIFSYVLGDTLVVDTIETARAYMGDYRMVTLDGDLVEKSGAMTGGSHKGTKFSFTSDGSGRLERIAAEITDLEDEKASVVSDLRGVEERLEDARDRKSDAADAVRSIESEIDDLESRRSSIDSEIESLESDLAELQAEKASTKEEMDEVTEAIAEQDEAIAEIEAEIEEYNDEIADSRIPELTEQIDAINEEIAGLESDIGDIDSKLNDLGLQKQYAEEATDELNEQIEDAQNRKAEHEETIAEHEATIAEHEETLAEKREAVEELEAEIADLKEDRAALKEDLEEARSARDEQQAHVSAVESSLEEATDRVEALEWEIESLEEEVGDYDAADVPDLEEVVEMIELFEADMTAMEPVNMKAIDDYDAVKTDLETIEEGKATLEEEAAGIRERIESYETQKKETFMDSYESIAAHFTEIFEKLSDGTGELHLENEEDPFDGGLTMKAQPGDKPVQRLNAMSGGEKSLTALSFIFAIQRHNPAPFYALDEVDAFLDAVNADRVGEMLDDLADKAQFVVVSHRSAMLERSERAIGVTMQDDNISAVTGIDVSGQGVPADD